MIPLSRRGFLAAASGSVAGLVLPDHTAPWMARGPHSSTGFPQQDLESVRRVVQVSHFDLDAVRALVTKRPNLAIAAWDWAFGDWESCIGAASHVGRGDIAEFLLAHGARPNLFTFAMQGKLDAVRMMIEARPGIQRSAGPHGLSLLHHARAGGRDAAAVVEYLEELGDADPVPTDLPVAAGQRRAYLGTYRMGAEDGTTFEIIERTDGIAFRYGQQAPRSLLHQGNHEFHPVGVPAVHFRFTVRGQHVEDLTIHDGRTVTVAQLEI